MDTYAQFAEDAVSLILDQQIEKMEQAQQNQRTADMIEAMCQNNILTMGRYQQRVTENSQIKGM